MRGQRRGATLVVVAALASTGAAALTFATVWAVRVLRGFHNEDVGGKFVSLGVWATVAVASGLVLWLVWTGRGRLVPLMSSVVAAAMIVPAAVMLTMPNDHNKYEPVCNPRLVTIISEDERCGAPATVALALGLIAGGVAILVHWALPREGDRSTAEAGPSRQIQR